MAEYIERETAVKAVMAAKWVDGSDGAMAMEIVASPAAADVAPVRHGWWLHSHYEDCSEHFEIVKCSNCDFEAYAMAFFVRSGNYCPNCGARMDGARNGEEED